jgi:2-polyprenyl-6-methoxyphenol hydroxylase-like FAD-dependent oxidoreductase
MWRKREPEVDVLVVGAGPVGLMTALLLAERGVGVRIIDREKWAGEHNFALTLHPSSLKLLDEVGLAGDLIARGTPVRRVAIRDRGGLRGELRLDELSDDMPYLLVLQQGDLERALEEALQRKGIKVEWARRLAELTPEAERVRFAIEELGVDSGGYPIAGHMLTVDRVRRGSAQFVVGADGFHSIVRRQLHVELDPFATPMWYAVAEIDRDLVPYGEAAIIVDGTSADAVWPLPGGGCRWSLQLDPFEASRRWKPAFAERVTEPGLAAGEVLALLGERAGLWFDVEGAVVGRSLIAHFEPALAQRFGVGRVQLAGDAAHVTSPVGVQSLNGGLAEAHDLAARLAHLIRTGAPPEALEAYNHAREASWRSLTSGPTTLVGADPWFAERAARFAAYLPGTGLERQLLGRQIGLELRA